jgi:hypothetical protein
MGKLMRKDVGRLMTLAAANCECLLLGALWLTGWDRCVVGEPL